jgi:arylsulfatase
MRSRRPIPSSLHIAVLALGLSLLVGCRERAPSHPDVILITLDTTRADHIGAYGYERDITPEMDRFAEDAVLYRRAWSTSPWTLPAHASIFTGKYPTSHGAHSNATSGDATLADALKHPVLRQFRVNRLGEEQVTLAELLRDAGYETAAFVGGPWLSPAFGLLQGYAVMDATVASIAGRSGDKLTRRAIAWIRDVPPERPLHLLINYFDAHAPYAPPPPYDDLPRAKARLSIKQEDVNRGQPFLPHQRAAYIDRYDGEIRFMDHHFGLLLDALRETGRYDEAMIIVVADHGESFGEHGLMGHSRWLYEEVLRVPLIIRFPGGRDAGEEIQEPVSVVDLLPLIAHEAHLSLPRSVEGVPVGRRDLVLAESYRSRYAVENWGLRFDRDLNAGILWPLKLVLTDQGAPEFYHLDEDPAELINRAGDPKEADLHEALKLAREALEPPKSVSLPEDVSPETHQRLQSLGYVE